MDLIENVVSEEDNMALMEIPLECFRIKCFPKRLNRTFIVLISKILLSINFNHFRLIILCKFIYKIISKLIASPMKCLLKKVISSKQ